MTFDDKVDKIIGQLEVLQTALRSKLDRGQGGELTEQRLDRVTMSIDAMRGELSCPHCESALTADDLEDGD